MNNDLIKVAGTLYKVGRGALVKKYGPTPGIAMTKKAVQWLKAGKQRRNARRNRRRGKGGDGNGLSTVTVTNAAPVSIATNITHRVTDQPVKVERGSEMLSYVNSTYEDNHFEVLVYPISAQLPRLAPMASQYRYYDWTSLSFQYVPSCASTTVGKIYLGWNQNLTDKGFQTVEELSAGMLMKSDNLWSTVTLQVPNKYFNKQYTPKSVQTPDSRDQDGNFSDKTVRCCIGVLSVFIEGYTAAEAIIGNLWMNYCVTFKTPCLNTEKSHFSGLRLAATSGNVANGAYVESFNQRSGDLLTNYNATTHSWEKPVGIFKISTWSRTILPLTPVSITTKFAPRFGTHVTIGAQVATDDAGSGDTLWEAVTPLASGTLQFVNLSGTAIADVLIEMLPLGDGAYDTGDFTYEAPD